MIKRILALAVIGCFCAGCGSTDNLEKSRDLRIGMVKEEVLQVMGEPIRDQSFVQPDVWFYYVSPQWRDGLITEDECLPLVFEEGKLIGWGNSFYAQRRLYRNSTLPQLK